MPDFRKTKQLFEEGRLMKIWNGPQELLGDELFEQKVINPDTKTYTQIADLPADYRKREIDPNTKYPIRQIFQIIHIKRQDG